MEPMVLTYQLGEQAVAVLRRVHNQFDCGLVFLFAILVISLYLANIQYILVLQANFYTG